MKKQGTESPATKFEGSPSQIVGYDDTKELEDLLCLQSHLKVNPPGAPGGSAGLWAHCLGCVPGHQRRVAIPQRGQGRGEAIS